MTSPLPYRIAVLCYLFDARGRVLLLHRCKPPNRNLYSPIGGKLEQAIGESPTDCAAREIQEEVGLTISRGRLHLTGMISECGYEDAGHWLIFLYEVLGPVDVTARTFDEGRLEWHDPATVGELALPATDREIIWPLFWRYRGRFFAAHIDCREGELRWTLDQPLGESAAVAAGDETGGRNRG